MGNPRETVFVVDDDPGVRKTVGSLLRSIGVQTTLFESTPELLAAAPPDAPACVILDVRMPGLSGLDCQRQLKKAGLNMPVIFMTGHGERIP